VRATRWKGITVRGIEDNDNLKYEKIGFTALSLGLRNHGASQVVKHFEELKKNDVVFI